MTTSTWRSYVYQPWSVGLSERPKPTRSGHTTRCPLLHEPVEHVPVEVAPARLAVEAEHRGAAALVEVVQAQAVHLGVVRLVGVAREVREALVGGAEDVHRSSFRQRRMTASQISVRVSHRGLGRHARLAAERVEQVALTHQVQRPRGLGHVGKRGVPEVGHAAAATARRSRRSACAWRRSRAAICSSPAAASATPRSSGPWRMVHVDRGLEAPAAPRRDRRRRAPGPGCAGPRRAPRSPPGSRRRSRSARSSKWR